MMATIDPDDLAHVTRWSPQDLNDSTVVFDGGEQDCPPIQPPTGIKWTSSRVSQTMFIPDSPPDLGLTFFEKGDKNPVFVRVPRSTSISMTGIHDPIKANVIRDALLSAIHHTKSTNTRGKNRQTFSPRPIANLGAQACRNKKGISANSYHKSLMQPAEWDAVVGFMRSCEKALKHVMPRESIRHIESARNCTDYPVMQSTSCREVDSSTIFSAISIAVDPILPGHTDPDMMYSCTSCFLAEDHDYILDDHIIVYFCFPTHGLAVPLRPGDILIFNPLTPHCISSKCRLSDTVIGTSMYVKTAIVGLNNNSINLLPNDIMLAEKYGELKKDQLHLH